ncbi:kinase-like domain-containing protein [Aspergillus floccosus]
MEAPPPADDVHNATLQAEWDRKPRELLSIIQGRELYNVYNDRVLESRPTNGRLVAVKIKSKDSFKRSEAQMMHYASENGIRAPRVLGCYNVAPTLVVTISDRVSGQSLDQVWHTMDRARQEGIKRQLREEPRKLTQPYAGRIGRQKTHCFFPRLGHETKGPFDSEKESDKWCLNRIEDRLLWEFWRPCLPAMRSKSTKFVLTHGDLAARNIMVDGDRITGIVDWEYSGFFPEYMEYAVTMAIHDCIEDWWLPVLQEVLEPCVDLCG